MLQPYAGSGGGQRTIRREVRRTGKSPGAGHQRDMKIAAHAPPMALMGHFADQMSRFLTSSAYFSM